ncbi:MAG: hypothetical protein HS105_07490 [Chloracidobacterium sp.]|nr:hypothetical protein [Chloracidobacterium sp.]MCC6824340.1 hypothetical protein [Acidobacteriota bacterium]MCO5332610.1 hypothetical protein [Pyrinomonadaceae bacterium]
MKHLLLIACFLLAGSVCISAQKGVDTQTQKIKDETVKVTTRSVEVGHSIDWGKGKTKVRDRLPNPYKLNSRRDSLTETIISVLRDKKIVVDEASSRLRDGLIVTQPVVFAKGAVISAGELRRYGVLSDNDSIWTRGQYTLTIEIQPIDGIQNNISVIAKVEGRAGNGLGSEWRTVPSSGLAEDEFLSKLVEAVTGVSPEPVQDVEKQP